MKKKLRAAFSGMYPNDRYFRGLRAKDGLELLNTDHAFSDHYIGEVNHYSPQTFSKSVRKAFIDGNIGWFHSYVKKY